MMPTLNRPAISWRVQATAGLAIVFTVRGGYWHWLLDEPNAKTSAPYESYPAAIAAARRHHGLPVIGPAGEHIPAPAKEEVVA